MTRTHTAKIEICRWKAHTCVGCACQYAYLMIRKLAYGGSTPERAIEKAEAAAQLAMIREVDRQPCPTCGLYQPDMIAAQRLVLHGWLLMASVLICAIIAALYPGEVVQAHWVLAAMMGNVAFFAALGFLVDLRNPNRNQEANRSAAQQEIAAGRMRVVQPGTPHVVPPLGHFLPQLPPKGGTTSAYGRLAIALVILALLALALPEFIRRQAGWPLNANCYPPVAGPGDEICLYLPDSILSMKGYWTGTSRITAHIASDPRSGEFAIESSTRQADWGRSIPLKPGERATKQRLWVRLKLPTAAMYAGTTLACKIALTVRYPVVLKDDILSLPVENYRNDATLELAAPFAAHTYRTWWWGGVAGGAVLLAASMTMRIMGAQVLRGTAKPSLILEGEGSQ